MEMQFVVSVMHPLKMMLEMGLEKNGSVVLLRGGYMRIVLMKLLLILMVKNAFAHFVLYTHTSVHFILSHL